MIDYELYTPVAGTQNLTGADAAATITRPTGAEIALITPEGTGARLRDDGTTVAAATGALLITLVSIVIAGPQFAAFSLWLATGTSCCIQYYKRNR